MGGKRSWENVMTCSAGTGHGANNTNDNQKIKSIHAIQHDDKQLHAYLAERVPAMRPYTTQSSSEEPPKRLEPCTPPITSPATYRPVSAKRNSVMITMKTRMDRHRIGTARHERRVPKFWTHRKNKIFFVTPSMRETAFVERRRCEL
jgi:hypothetical protein